MGDRRPSSNERPLLRSPPRARSDVSALNGVPQTGGYVPYQDALYYRTGNFNSSDGSDERDKRYRTKRYTVHERKWRKHPNGDFDYWENRGHVPGSGFRMSQKNVQRAEEQDDENHAEDETDTDEDRAMPAAGASQRRKPKKKRRSSQDESNEGESENDSRHSHSSRRKRRSSKTESEQRDPREGGIPGRRPDPKLSPREDPKRPKESYTALKALKSAAFAGGVEVVRCRLEPGPWSGQKGQRVALAAAVGCAIGALRNGRLLNSGKMPYAEAAMTGFYSIDFLKRVARHSEHSKDAMKEQEEWYKDEEYVADRDRRAADFQGGR